MQNHTQIKNLLPRAEIEQIREHIERAQNILLISHKNPDGDTLGSTLALLLALEQFGKKSTPCCVNKPASCFSYLPHIHKYIYDFEPDHYDLIFVIDAGAHYMTKFHETKPDLFGGSYPVINIDHHSSNDYFGTVSLVVHTAAATAHIMYFLFKQIDIKITRDIATCLLTGLYTDTGSFMHSNTTPEIYEIAGKLIERGADFQTIAKANFKTTSINQMKLWGRILEKTEINDKKITSSGVTRQDFEICHADPGELAGVIDYLNTVPEAKLCILLAEHQNGTVKGSMRTQNDNINLAKIAELFGGGGHAKAAGFTMQGNLTSKTAWRIQSQT